MSTTDAARIEHRGWPAAWLARLTLNHPTAPLILADGEQLQAEGIKLYLIPCRKEVAR